MSDSVFNVLFLCTGNTARSILAEAILRHDGRGRFRAFSAGSHPKGAVNPFALHVLKQFNYPSNDLTSKSWDKFVAPNAPVMDFVFTVCDAAADETCPYWPGSPHSAHWGIADPAAVEGPDHEKERAFVLALHLLQARIGAFLSLSIHSLSKTELQQKLALIGQMERRTG